MKRLLATALLLLVAGGCSAMKAKPSSNVQPPAPGVPATASDVTGIYRSIHQGLLQLRAIPGADVPGGLDDVVDGAHAGDEASIPTPPRGRKTGKRSSSAADICSKSFFCNSSLSDQVIAMSSSTSSPGAAS